jgi:hypothetical protein
MIDIGNKRSMGGDKMKGEVIKGADNLYKGEFIMKDINIYKIIYIDNTYVASKYTLEDIKTHEEKEFDFVDLIGSEKIKLSDL